jgi:hypothetical protein
VSVCLCLRFWLCERSLLQMYVCFISTLSVGDIVGRWLINQWGGFDRE